ncbi:MAG: PAS domain S-box protein [Dehalococcoidia bacterium]|nr:PAS domain S-box protein [Dehalococcoidia bacterium]
MRQVLVVKRVTELLKRPSFWLISLTLLLVTVLHYREAIGYPQFLIDAIDEMGITRHSFERILYLAPIVWSGFLLGRKGILAASIVALLCMLPRALFISDRTTDATLESLAVFILGMVVALSFRSLKGERERRTQLEEAEKRLQSQLQVIRENEKRLAALNQTAAILSESLELGGVLEKATDNVINVMQAEVAMISLIEEGGKELVLAAHRGLSKQFVEVTSRVKLSETFNGRVTESGKMVLDESAFRDSDPARKALEDEGIQSLLVVPMKSKGSIVGTLSVATRCRRKFPKEDVELLTAIANQVGVAIENARLYEKERLATQKLAASEKSYRGLFENAHDAIWVHDLDGNYIVANEASEQVTGYSVEDLKRMNVKHFLSDEGLQLAREVGRRLLAGEPLEQPYEQRMIGRDGNESILKVTTSLVTEDGKVTGFHHIARDVTEEMRLRENLDLYLSQVTKAQEEERKRIARELHDDTIQALVVLSRQLEDAASSGKGLPEDKKLLLENLRQQTTSIMDGVRRLTQDLRPSTLDRLGLLPGLEWLANDMSTYSGIATKVSVAGKSRRLPPDVELMLFRIAQEGLRNVWRHSHATEAEVAAEFQEKKVVVTIKDNGKGFSVPGTVGDLTRDGKLGLTGMHERARLVGGSVTLQSEPGKGTTIVVEVPV